MKVKNLKRNPLNPENVKKQQEKVKKQAEENGVEEEKKVLLPTQNTINNIKCKAVRQMKVHKMLKEKAKAKRLERKMRIQEGAPKGVTHTIESLREKDETMIEGSVDDEHNAELKAEIEIDEFSSYYNKNYEPKVLISYSDNPTRRSRIFGRELNRIIPNSISLYRNRSGVKKMVKAATEKGFSDIVIINEDRCRPNGLLIIHLPEGPTAYFKMSNVKLTPDLKRSHKEITEHRPEVILNNFTTRLGFTVGRMLGALFHHEPEFKGRRAVTFHNQRDYIFFRHHRYEFNLQNGKARLRELGPRFTLKLKSLQHGTFDSKYGEYEWIIQGKRHSMESSRRKFFL